MIGETNSFIQTQEAIENVNVIITSNQNEQLSGVTFTVAYGEYSKTYTWEGNSINFQVPEYITYTLTFSDLSGYTTPNVVSNTAVGGNARTITATYSTTIVTVVMADNQTSYNDISSTKATVTASGISATTVSSGGTVKVPTGVSCTITWTSVSGYKTPSSQTFTTSGTTVTKTGTYQTEILTVNVTSDEGDLSGYTITVGSIGSQTTASKVYKVPFGTSYTVSASGVDGFTTPDSVTYTANSISRTVTMTYVYNPIVYNTVTFVDSDASNELAITGDTSWIKGRRCLMQFDSDLVAHIVYLSDDTSFETVNGETVTESILIGQSSGTSSYDVCWMTELPEYWYYMDESTSGIHILNISQSAVDGWKHSPKVYVGVTELSVGKATGVMGSSYGSTSTGSKTIEQFDNCLYGSDNQYTKLFELISYDTHCKIAHLFYAKYGNRNPQTMDLFGYGENSYTRTCGTTASLGNNDGHTDTQISFLGIEDFYGGKYEFMSGINGNVGTYYIYQGLQPNQIPTVDYRTVDCVFTSSKSGYITNLKWGEYADMIPTGFNSGSSSTHYCDYGYVAYSGWRVAVRSGVSASDSGGVACFYALYSSSRSSASVGSRIEYRGDVVVGNNLISNAIYIGTVDT